MKYWGVTLLLTVWAGLASAGEVTVAVASNFLTTAEKIAAAFEAETGHSVRISHGSTGQLYAQIENGAPFDIFLAGDAERPARLRQDGRTRNIRTYALGHLMLVARLPITVENAAEMVLDRTVALADPIVAPYGKAATRAMERLKFDTATFRPILVANVGQVASVFATGNADFAFVAESQAALLDAPHALSLEDLIPDIRQDAALLVRSDGNAAAEALWDWLASPAATTMIVNSGYGLSGG